MLLENSRQKVKEDPPPTMLEPPELTRRCCKTFMPPIQQSRSKIFPPPAKSKPPCPSFPSWVGCLRLRGVAERKMRKLPPWLLPLAVASEFRAWSGFAPRASAFPAVGQPRRFVAENHKEIEGLGCLLRLCPGAFTRNLPGICSELGVRSEFARNALRKRPRPAMRGNLQRHFFFCFEKMRCGNWTSSRWLQK